jgi:hypothetical protein
LAALQPSHYSSRGPNRLPFRVSRSTSKTTALQDKNGATGGKP